MDRRTNKRKYTTKLIYAFRVNRPIRIPFRSHAWVTRRQTVTIITILISDSHIFVVTIALAREPIQSHILRRNSEMWQLKERKWEFKKNLKSNFKNKGTVCQCTVSVEIKTKCYCFAVRMKVYSGSKGIAPCIPSVSTRWKLVVNITLRQYIAGINSITWAG